MHSGMLRSWSKKDSRSAGGSPFTSDLSRFLKEFLESYGMAMVSTLVSSNLFFGSLFQRRKKVRLDIPHSREPKTREGGIFAALPYELSWLTYRHEGLPFWTPITRYALDKKMNSYRASRERTP